MKRLIFLIVFPILTFSQTPTLFPDATWLQDVHFAGTIYGGVPAGVMTNVQAHLNGLEYMFHIKTDVEKARPLITNLHAQGKKYWVNLDGTLLEGSVSQILNDGQGISDSLFGVARTLQGNTQLMGNSVFRSINRPEWRNFLISCIKRAIDAGADGSQHDGAGTSDVINFSFDDEDVSAFKSYVITNSISTGDWNTSTTTFKEYLLSKGKTDENVFDYENDPTNIKTLIIHWKNFKTTQIKKSWQMLKDSCLAYAVSKNKKYTIALNAGSAIGQSSGIAYFVSDYAIGEFFDWGNLWPYTGLLTVRTRLFESIGKRFVNWSGPTLNDVPLNPGERFSEQIEKETNMHMASQLYASGGVPQLGFPAFSTYPVFNFAQLNRSILNTVNPAGDIGVVFSHAQLLQGETRDIQGLLLAMQDINRSFKVIFFRSNYHGENDNLVLSDLNKFKVIFLPEVYYLTNNQRTVLLSYVNGGGILLNVRGVAYAGNYDENGNDQTNTTWKNLADVATSSVKNYGAGKFITIQHLILESNGYPTPNYGFSYSKFKNSTLPEEATVANQIRDTISKWIDYALPQKDVSGLNIPATIRFFRHQDTLTNTFVYQVLNDSVQLPSREAISVGPLTIELAVSQSAISKSFNVDFHSIDDPNGTSVLSSISPNQSTGRIALTIPKFKRWGFVLIREVPQTTKSIAIKNLKVNDSLSFHRLRSNTDAKLSWDITIGQQKNVEVEVWTNIELNGTPLLDISALQAMSGDSEIKKIKLSTARRIIHKIVSSSSLSYLIPSSILHDSIVYLARVRAISQSNDTSSWIENFIYRNVPPRSPVNPLIYIQHQQLWYSSPNGEFSAGTDTSNHLIYAIFKGSDDRGAYGGDWELDTITYFVNIYTDSTTGKKGDTVKAIHKIGTEINATVGPFGNKSNIDDMVDTVSFSLSAYENFGIYIRPVATDRVDSSKQGAWFSYYLDNHNDPPNPFPLVSPANNSTVADPQPVIFKWIYKGDPDPFGNGSLGYGISKVSIIFDSVNTFNSPGLRTYSQNITGPNIKTNDTVKITLPPNFAQVENINKYKKLYWKAIITDRDRSVAEGGGKGTRERESSEYFVLNNSSVSPSDVTPPATPTGLTATAGNSQIVLTWTANSESDLASYKVYGGATASPTSLLATITRGTVTYTHLSLANGTTYYYKISAVDSSGNESNKTNDVSAIPLSPPIAPTLKYPISNAINTPINETLKWNRISTATSYDLQLSLINNFTVLGKDTTTSDTAKYIIGLLNNTKYYWRVRGKNVGGTGEWSTDSFKTIISPPNVSANLLYPTNASINLPTNVIFKWNKISSAEKYVLNISTTQTFNQLVKDTTVIDTTYKGSGLSINTKYFWRVKGINIGGDGPFSDSREFTTGTNTFVNELNEIPKKYILSQNYPNPFNPSTTIRFGLSHESNVKLEIYNSLGQLIKILVNGKFSAHNYEVKWESEKNPSGLYYYKLTAIDINNPSNNLIETKNMVLMK